MAKTKQVEETPGVVRTVAKRWTPKLAERGFTPLANDFLDLYQDMGITNPQALFIIFLLRHKWSEADPFPGYRSIAARMGVEPRRVRQLAKELEAAGFIVRRARGEGSKTRARSHSFDLKPLFQAVEQCAGLEEETPPKKGRKTQRGGGADASSTGRTGAAKKPP